MTTPDHEPRGGAEAQFAERMALYFGALFLVYGVHITAFPLWLHGRGLAPEQIGLITALPIFMRTLATPAIAAYADTRGNHRQVIIGLSALSAGLAIAMTQLHGFWPLALAAVPFAISIATIMPLTETIAVAGVRRGGHDYGRMRLWGSLTFLAATLAAGVLYDAYGQGVGIYALIAATLATAAAAAFLPRPPAVEVREKTGAGAGPPAARESELIAKLLRSRHFLAFLLAMGAIHGAHATFYTFGALHLKGQGISGTAFGMLWAISIFAEMAVLAYSGPLIARFGPVKLIIAGGAAGMIRWGAMSLDPAFEVIIVLQALHAITYGAAHIGAIHFIAQAVPNRGGGTAQALYSAIGSGFVTGLATLASGHLYPVLGGQTFLVMAALSGAGLAAAVAIHKSWQRTPII